MTANTTYQARSIYVYEFGIFFPPPQGMWSKKPSEYLKPQLMLKTIFAMFVPILTYQ
jgi:hypothetical protein